MQNIKGLIFWATLILIDIDLRCALVKRATGEFFGKKINVLSSYDLSSMFIHQKMFKATAQSIQMRS